MKCKADSNLNTPDLIPKNMFYIVHTIGRDKNMKVWNPFVHDSLVASLFAHT